jgi:oligoendopeptidase F
MTRSLFVGIALGALALAAFADGDRYRWNLADIYPSQTAWDADATLLDKQITDFAACKGQLGTSGEVFKKCMDAQSEMSRRMQRLDSFASQTHHEDMTANSGIELTQRVSVLGNHLQQATAFVNPELLALGQTKLNELLATDPSLTIYRHPIDDVLRFAPHTLDAQGESLIAAFDLTSSAADSIYSTLSNADMPWPKLKLTNGKEVILDQAAYTKYRAAANRQERKRVFDTFWKKWREYEHTFGTTFYEQLKRDSVDARVRHYPDTLTSALDGNQLPRGVYDTLIEQARANLPTLHRYFKLRGAMLGVKQMQYYDIYPPLVSSKRKYDIDASVKHMLAAVEPLGTDYVNAMSQGVGERWMDVYPRPHKLSGAYMNGAVYDAHPFLLLNHNDDYESLSTLAHEWGHAMHSLLANRAQPYVTAAYPTFTAEIASTTNEVLMLDHMLKQASSDDERLLYLGSALENLRGTFFRQAMFADFEQQVHARVDRGESLTGEALTKLYLKILRDYHGHAQGVVNIDELYGIEWAYIPHFYRRFYVFQYATSITAGTAFAERILAGEPGARERYLSVLKAGGSRYPYELVKEAGVDLASPAPYQALVARMNAIMDRIEAIRAKKH